MDNAKDSGVDDMTGAGTLRCPAKCVLPGECISLRVDQDGIRCTWVGPCPKGVDKNRVGRSVVE